MTDEQQNPPIITTERFIADAIVRLEAQAEASDRLAELARGQGDLIESGESDQLLSVLQRRQSLIDELLGVISDIGPLAEAVQRAPGGVTDNQRETVRRLVDSIGRRLAEVIDIDARDRTRLETRLRAISQEREAIGSARTARAAYDRAAPFRGPLAGSVNRFTDESG